MTRSKSIALFATAPALAMIVVANLGNDKVASETEEAMRELRERVAHLESVAQEPGGEPSQGLPADLPVGTVVAFAGEWPAAGPARQQREDQLGWKLCDGSPIGANEGDQYDKRRPTDLCFP